MTLTSLLYTGLQLAVISLFITFILLETFKSFIISALVSLAGVILAGISLLYLIGQKGYQEWMLFPTIIELVTMLLLIFLIWRWTRLQRTD